MWKKVQFLTQNCYPSIETVGTNKVAKTTNSRIQNRKYLQK